MDRVPLPLHWWLLAAGKTAQWLIAYANQPGDAVGGAVEVDIETAAAPQPKQEQDEDGS